MTNGESHERARLPRSPFQLIEPELKPPVRSD
jgi:hypothetical protein